MPQADWLQFNYSIRRACIYSHRGHVCLFYQVTDSGQGAGLAFTLCPKVSLISLQHAENKGVKE